MRICRLTTSSSKSWYAWGNSNLDLLLRSALPSLPSFTSFSFSLHTVTPIQGICFRSEAEPICLQLHRLKQSFVTVFLRSAPRNRPPECDIRSPGLFRMRNNPSDFIYAVT